MVPKLALVSASEVMRDAVSDSLRARGFPVRCFATSRALLASGLRGEACIVLDLDRASPQGDGKPAMLRELEDAQLDIPIILLTGTLDRPRSPLGSQKPVLMLTKPIDPWVLAETIRQLASMSRGAPYDQSVAT